jgi:uncharacterized protein DUF1707
MPDSNLRAADSDRAAVAAALGEHMSAGRLTLAEYDDRVAQAYAAKTFGELAELTADLPSSGRAPAHAPVPTPVAHSAPVCGPSPWAGRSSHSWRAWLSTSLIVVTIWLATSISAGRLDYFWPIWVIGPWGAVILAGQITGGGRDRRRRLGP